MNSKRWKSKIYSGCNLPHRCVWLKPGPGRGGFSCVHWFKVKGRCLFCFCWLNCGPSRYVKFPFFDMVYRWILYKSNTTDATSGTRIFMLSVKHMSLNILIQWQFATLTKLKFKTMLFSLQEEYLQAFKKAYLYMHAKYFFSNKRNCVKYVMQ
jgi:hypothetical protein